MMNPTREQIALALFKLLSGISAFAYASRRPQLWNEATAMPALYMGNPNEEYVYQHGTGSPAHITLSFDIFIYINVGLDPNTIPDTQVNNLLDTLETTLGGVAINGQPQTLGGIVNQAWIEGPVHRVPGYLNGQGMVILTIKVLVPS